MTLQKVLTHHTERESCPAAEEVELLRIRATNLSVKRQLAVRMVNQVEKWRRAVCWKCREEERKRQFKRLERTENFTPSFLGEQLSREERKWKHMVHYSTRIHNNNHYYYILPERSRGRTGDISICFTVWRCTLQNISITFYVVLRSWRNGKKSVGNLIVGSSESINRECAGNYSEITFNSPETLHGIIILRLQMQF